MSHETQSSLEKDGFARLAEIVGPQEWQSRRSSAARFNLRLIIAAKDGGVWDIAVGDFLELETAAA